ncbi:hypothetical protein ACTUVJ_003421, partial [Stenotrophomonas indicatrix]
DCSAELYSPHSGVAMRIADDVRSVVGDTAGVVGNAKEGLRRDLVVRRRGFRNRPNGYFARVDVVAVDET